MDNNSSLRQDILKKLSAIDNLPTLPAVISKLGKILGDTNAHIRDVEKILNNDPAIAAKILKTVNSPIFNRSGEKIEKLSAAISRLGFKEIKNISLGTAVFSMFDKVKSKLFNRKEFWKHSFFTSLISLELGKIFFDKGLPEDELHIAGLVHDIGKIILDAYFNDTFEQCLALALQEQLTLCDAERVVMDIDHAELGFIIAESWNLPAVAMETIRFHHTPREASEKYKDIVFIVHIANYISNTQDLGISGDLGKPVFDKQVFDYLNISPDNIKTIIDNVKYQSGNIEEILNE